MHSSPKKLVIAGTGFPDAVKIIDSLNLVSSQKHELLGFLDDNENNKTRDLLGYRIIGGFDWIKGKSDVFVFNSIARDASIREKATKKLSYFGAKFISLIAPDIQISYSRIGEGCFLGIGVYLGAKVSIGDQSLVLSNTSINHDSSVGENCFVGSGVNIQGHVNIGKNCFIASGAAIAPGVSIGDGAKIGFNSVITNDVRENQTYFSRPAQKLQG